MSDDLDVKGLIGEGAFGKVFLLENAAGDQAALKVIDLKNQDQKIIFQTIQEIQLLAKLDHEHILEFLHCNEDAGVIYLLTEYCCNGDLNGYAEKHRGQVLEESRLVEWVRQITSALQYLHGNNIIHRDLKSANVFLNEKWDTKLGDFGIARVLQSPVDLAQTMCGTPVYMSPEAFSGIPYTTKTDIYSLGVLMYELASMDKDFNSIMPQMLLFLIVRDAKPTMPTCYSDGVVDLLTMMMVNSPTKRPSAADILKHPLFRSTRKPAQLPQPPNKEVAYSSDEIGSLNFERLKGTLSLIGKGRATSTLSELQDMVKAYEVDAGFEAHPVMALVTRVMDNMGQTTRVALQGRKSHLERQVEMLKMYCLQVLDNDKTLFTRACDTLDKSQDEEEIEEALIRVLGHERYGLCGVQLLYYKNFTFNLRK